MRSLLHVPLPFQRSTWGFVALVTIDRPLGMDDDLIALVQLAGESFMTALARADDGAALLDARRELEYRNEELERSNEELERFAYAAVPRPQGAAGPHRDGAGGHAEPGGRRRPAHGRRPPRGRAHAPADRGPAHVRRRSARAQAPPEEVDLDDVLDPGARRPRADHRRGGRHGRPAPAAPGVGASLAPRPAAAEPGGQRAQVHPRRRRARDRRRPAPATTTASRSAWPTTASGSSRATAPRCSACSPGSTPTSSSPAAGSAWPPAPRSWPTTAARSGWRTASTAAPPWWCGSRTRRRAPALELRPGAGLAAALPGAVAQRPGPPPRGRVGSGERRAWRRRRPAGAPATSRWWPRRPARPPPARCARRSGRRSRPPPAAGACRR